MPILTLLTDWGTRDHYIAAMKGDMYRRLPSANIVDITHQVEPFDRMRAAFILQNAYPHFPEGTIHYIGVNGDDGTIDPSRLNNHLVVASQGHLFVGIDCGIFSLLFQDQEKKAWRLPIEPDQDRHIIQDQLAGFIAELLNGKSPSKLGTPHDQLIDLLFPRPTIDSSGMRGSVIYIDSFGNAVFNITRDLFDRERSGRKFTVLVRNANYRINRIYNRFDEVDDGELVAIFNQEGHLEIALNHANSAQLLGIKLFDSILIEFHDN